MNAPPPQASYPCGNFSGISYGDTKYTSPYKVRWAVLSHVIVSYVSIRVRSKGNISPYGLSEVSVLTELPVGHLCCSLTDVPPQSNSPSVGVPVGVESSREANHTAHSKPVRQPNRQVAVFHGRFRVSNRMRYVHTRRVVRFPGWIGPSCMQRDTPNRMIAVDSKTTLRNHRSQSTRSHEVRHPARIHSTPLSTSRLRSSPGRPAVNHRLESSSKGSSCPVVSGFHVIATYHAADMIRIDKPVTPARVTVISLESE